MNRIGIDVGGTFTHTVAIDAQTLSIVHRVKVPTTHRAPEGVARGIVDSLLLLLQEGKIDPHEVGLIAYSTTQATNALLEGDVAAVGVLGMGRGALAERGTCIGKLELAPGRFLKTHHRFLDTRKYSRDAVKKALEELRAEGAEAFAISEAFSVDDPSREQEALAIAQELGLLATAGSDISRLYGLKARTRTAVINASMLPKMLESAEMTERSVREAGIQAPLMVMRSDGGVMSIDEMRRRPILTMLSGPAAGVAAAMMYLRISDGVFLEVGGTSTDISTIKNGKAQIQSAEVGGHRIYLRTLAVQTLGVAGGSIPRLKHGKVSQVGPRSAHIAGVGYAAFTDLEREASLQLIQPLARDPQDYLSLRGSQTAVTLTPTCAANLLSFVPEGDPARGDDSRLKSAFETAARALKTAPHTLAQSILTKATDPVQRTVRRMMEDGKLDAKVVALVGGGGGAAAIVPFLSRRMNVRHELSQNSDVLSAIGVALAMVRDSVERSVLDPTQDDILRIRKEAESAVMKMGADPQTIEVQIEIDPKKNTLRATATGATELRTKDLKGVVSAEEAKEIAKQSLGADPIPLGEAGAFRAFGWTPKRWFSKPRVRVVDREGVIRLQTNSGQVRVTAVSEAVQSIGHLAEEGASYGDGGKTIPDLFALHGNKILDLTGLLTSEQAQGIARVEFEGLPPEEAVLLLASFR